MGIQKLSDVLILSGLPGSGKTYYAQWLEGRGWLCLEGDKPDRGPMDHARHELVANLDVPGFVDAAAVAGKPMVVEWGFPVRWLPQLRELLEAGFNCWWFDGNRQATLISWRGAQGKARDHEWQTQVRDISECWPDIATAYGPERILRTIGPGPFHLPPQQIHRLLGLA